MHEVSIRNARTQGQRKVLQQDPEIDFFVSWIELFNRL